MHHLVIDGVSWRILLGDLEAAYQQHQSEYQAALRNRTPPSSAPCRVPVRVAPETKRSVAGTGERTTSPAGSAGRACSGCSASSWSNHAAPRLADDAEQVIDPLTAYQMTSLLEGVVEGLMPVPPQEDEERGPFDQPQDRLFGRRGIDGRMPGGRPHRRWVLSHREMDLQQTRSHPGGQARP